MKVETWAFLQLAILSTGMLPAVAAADSYLSLERHSFAHDGIEREFFVHVPDDANGALPVVAVLVYP